MIRSLALVAVLVTGGFALPTAALAAPASFSEIAGTIGKRCDRGLVREIRDWGIKPTSQTGSRMEWPGPGRSKVMCQGRDPHVVRIQFDNGWPLPRGIAWKNGWGKARKSIEKGGGRIVRRWKDDDGKHIHAVIDGVKIGMHWPKGSGLTKVAIEAP